MVTKPPYRPRYKPMQHRFNVFTPDLNLDSAQVRRKMDARYTGVPYRIERRTTNAYTITMTMSPPWDAVFAERDKLIAVIREVERGQGD